MANKTLDDIQKRKEELIKESKTDLSQKINEFNNLTSSQAAEQNAGALNSYQAYLNTNGPQKQTAQPLNATDYTTARSAYLNRLASVNNAAENAALDINAAKDYYNAYLDAAASESEANIAALRYEDAVNADTLKYEDERNAIADARWQREYENTKKAYEEALRSYSSSGYGSSGYGYLDGMALTDSSQNSSSFWSPVKNAVNSIIYSGAPSQPAYSGNDAGYLEYLTSKVNNLPNLSSGNLSQSTYTALIQELKDAGAGTDLIYNVVKKMQK